MITVSVIIPIFNAQSTIIHCIDSIFKQTLNDVEIICVDDGSTDYTVEILEQWRSEKFIIIRQSNSGAGIARNAGIKVARGEYVVFMDADDCYPNEYCLEKLYNAAQKNEALVCAGNMLKKMSHDKIEISKDGEFISEGWIDYFDFQQSYNHQKYLFKRLMLVENNLLYPPYRRYQDPVFLCKVLTFVRKFYSIPDPVYMYTYKADASKFTKEKIIDALRGCRDVLQISSEMGLSKLHQDTIKNAHYFEQKAFSYYEDSPEDELYIVAEEVNSSINVRMIDGIYIFNYNKKIFLQKVRHYFQELEKNILKFESVIVYGAGDIGKKVCFFLEKKHFHNYCKAVTSDNSRMTEIKLIFECKNKEALVLISNSNAKSQMEMQEICNALGFENVIIVDSKMINAYEIISDDINGLEENK